MYRIIFNCPIDNVLGEAGERSHYTFYNIREDSEDRVGEATQGGSERTAQCVDKL